MIMKMNLLNKKNKKVREEEEAAKAAGADYVGLDELVGRSAQARLSL